MPFGEGWDLPAEAAPWSDFHWFSVPVSGSLRLTVISERPMWYTGHYQGGRMVPCVPPGCEPCGQGVGAQVRYAFAVADWETRRVGLVEVGRNNGLMIRELALSNGGLRGMVLDLSKEGRHRQSRTHVTYCGELASDWALGQDVPDVGLALYLTWVKAGCRVPEELARAYGARYSRSSARSG